MKAGTGRWTCCYWEESYNQLDMVRRQEGLVAPGIYFMPPPVGDITLHDGLWDELNDKLGTLFDMAEEESIGPDLLPDVAMIVFSFAKQRYSKLSGLRTVQIGQQIAPQSKPLIAQMPLVDLQGYLQKLGEFLANAGDQEKIVIISL
ncbi:MAG: hypothetical protein GY833_24740 [Aestuariibacter sp.]|nr:hypothetical protein [Aestuariibacter sp.]